MVCPSGALLATARVAMVPPAPPRLSTTICWPIDLLILSATMRPSASLPPPGGNGMTSVTGRVGYAWAAAPPGASDDATNAPPARTMNSRRLIWPSRAARTASQPTNLGFISILEGRNPFAVTERERNIVRAGQKALLPERVDFEPVDRTIRSRRRLCFEIDGDMASGRLLQYGSQRRNPLGGQHNRQQAVLEAVVEKYVAEARRQHGPDPVIVKRPYRRLARRFAAEIAIRDHDAGVAVCVPVEHEFWLRRAGVVESQVMEQQVPPAVTAFAPQETR